MDDFLGAIFGAIFVIAIIVFLVVMFALACANLIVAVDQVLGVLVAASPGLSWVVNGFVIFSLLYFAFQEAPRLNHPGARPAALWALGIWLCVQMVL